jgi:basic membrane protein A and related proteins
LNKTIRTAAVGLVLATGLTAPALTAQAQSGKKVALLFDVTGRGDKSFNDLAAKALDDAKAKLSIDATESAPTGDADRPERVKAVIDAKNGFVLCVGFLWDKDCNAAAKANPTVAFASVDGALEGANTASLNFAEEQGSYLVGVIAAQASKTNKIGFIGGVRIDLIQKFQAGFEAGVKSVKPKAKIEVKYATEPPDFSGFGDPAKGKAIAAAMYKSGIDVVYHAAGSTGLGLFAAAKESGKKPGKIWAIGVDADQYQTVNVDGGRDYILTSMLKRVDVASYAAIKAFVDGKPLAGRQVFDLKADGVGYSTTNAKVKPYLKKVEAAKKAILDGKVVVPTKPAA